MPIIEVTLHLERETKGAILYTTKAPDAPITNLYIRKAGLTAPYPDAIKVEVTV